MKPIQICLWFADQAEEAANLYTSLFEGSAIGTIARYGKAGAQVSGQAEGSVMTVELELAGTRLLGLNGGPHFRFNPTMSLFVGCESEAEIDRLWKKLPKNVRMELQKYPFAPKYGWCEDRYGMNWQLILGPRRQKISPALLFANQRYGKVEEAIRFYISLFPGSEIEKIARDERTGAVLHSAFTLAGQSFVAMEGPLPKEFDFSPAMSFVVPCASQEEIDDIWGKLSAVPEAERCGWLQDKFGVSWQVVHQDWGKLISEASPQKREQILSAIFKMKKPVLKLIPS